MGVSRTLRPESRIDYNLADDELKHEKEFFPDVLEDETGSIGDVVINTERVAEGDKGIGVDYVVSAELENGTLIVEASPLEASSATDSIGHGRQADLSCDSSVQLST